MEDLLLRSAIIITPETMRNTIFTKEDRDLIFLHKKHIIKNLYKKSPLFKQHHPNKQQNTLTQNHQTNQNPRKWIKEFVIF
jgi:hypothetical protein